MYGIIFLFFLSPLYLLLMRSGKVFLLFLPILAFLLLLSWELVFPAEPAGRENPAGPLTPAP